MNNHNKYFNSKNIHVSLLDLYSYLKIDKLRKVRIVINKYLLYRYIQQKIRYKTLIII
jgi:hypothetical protein